MRRSPTKSTSHRKAMRLKRETPNKSQKKNLKKKFINDARVSLEIQQHPQGDALKTKKNH